MPHYIQVFSLDRDNKDALLHCPTFITFIKTEEHECLRCMRSKSTKGQK